VRLALLVVVGVACGGHHPTAPDGGTDAGASADAGPCTPRCVSSTELGDCGGRTITCAAGSLCGADPQSAADACVKPGDACGTVPYDPGLCAGTVFEICDPITSTLDVADCADVGAVCTGGSCSTPCGNVTATGTCQGNAIERCVWSGDAYGVATEPCAAGETCGFSDETVAPACLPSTPCGLVGPAGACAGSVLSQCSTGNVVSIDCATTGEVCAWSGATYACAPGGTAGARVVSGTVRFEKKLLVTFPDGTAGRGAIVQRPARGASVAVVDDADDSVLAWALTADDGSYALRYDAAAGASVHVLAATTNPSAVRPARVVRTDDLVHGFASSSFAVAASSSIDLLVTDASSESEAFNVFDDLIEAQDQVRAVLAIAAPHPTVAIWERGSQDGTYYEPTGEAIHLLGGPGDDDGYDDAPILHEFGHSIEFNYGRFSSLGGAHNGQPVTPTLAWSEGFATYWSSVARGDSLYADTNVAGGWDYDLESSVTTANPSLPLDQDVSEDTVSEILWDCGDAPVPDDDPIAGTHADVLTVEKSFASSGWPATDRAATGVDLVDWLDGWLAAHLAECAGLKTIVNLRMFPYDFPGCP
jgi:hypothetical protein